MRLITGSEMRKLEKWAIQEYGVPSLLLMENAGGAVVRKAEKILGELSGRQIIVLAGKGNNGGDALVAARRLAEMSAEVRLFLLFPPEAFSPDALENWHLVEKQGLKWHILNDENSFYLFKLRLNQCDLVIDGIFGTGFRGKPEQKICRVIHAVNESKPSVLAIDTPSGLEADTGRIEDCCIRADDTVTFTWIKRGLVVFPGKEYAGRLEVAGISLPREAIAELKREEYYVNFDFVRGILPPLNWQGHKNSFGHVLVIAGSAGMTGAAHFASKAAFRAGAGMVTACLPYSLAASFDAVFPEVITRGVAETDQQSIDAEAWPVIRQQLKNRQAIVFGPGLSATESVRAILEKLVEEAEAPLVIDADGLNVLALNPEILQNAKAPVILTPHPGEMARLLGISTEDVQQDRVSAAVLAAESLQAIVVLKGAATVTALPEGTAYINSTGCPALATAGTGDILAGLISGFIAQGVSPAQAAYLGVYVHGLAGDLAAAKLGMRGVMATDVLEMLPYALRSIEED
ncbi:MAG: NAD(P)H-hydrate dehydratase [Clostridia bacterium]|jgi:NAD(P)H-hydrate epimerase|nr:NAD(P)H-hydrate dehydratase [Clostridia bacterium]